jgi:predicted lipid-binding transport protein (Tim44 family)
MYLLQYQKKKSQFGVVLLIVFLFCGIATLADARVGGGSSMGSRGSRSFSAPARPTNPFPGGSSEQRSTPPAYASPYSQRTQEPFGRTPYAQTSPYGGGGFWRSVGGGLVGGFLGSMLFRSLGFASPGASPGMGGGWGGPGLFDLLLLGLLGYAAYRFLSYRATTRSDRYYTEPNRSSSDYEDRSYDRYPAPVTSLPSAQGRDVDQGIEQLRMLDPGFDRTRFCDQAMDFFFRLQAAWSVRDLNSLRPQLTEELAAQLQVDIEQLKREGKLNRVENIAVRTCELTEVWQESGQDFVTVYFYANCLDYDVSESTGEVVRGSKLEPTKFEEFWTFTRPAGRGSWKLSAITQA